MNTIGFCKVQRSLDLGVDHFPTVCAVWFWGKFAASRLDYDFLLSGFCGAAWSQDRPHANLKYLSTSQTVPILCWGKPHALLCHSSLGTTRLHQLTWTLDEVCWRQNWVQGPSVHSSQVLILHVPLFLRWSLDQSFRHSVDASSILCVIQVISPTPCKPMTCTNVSVACAASECWMAFYWPAGLSSG